MSIKNRTVQYMMTKNCGIGKRELNKARKRAEIVQVAARMFLEQGYAATTMSAIADTLGGSKATLWAHFSSKEDVFAAVLDLHVGTFSSSIDEVLVGQTFSVPALRRVCLRLIGSLLSESSVLLYRMVVSEGDRFPELLDAFYTRGPMKLRTRIAGFFATVFSDDEAHALTQLVVAAVTGYRSDLILKQERAGANHEAFVDLMLAHIAWPEPPSRV